MTVIKHSSSQNNRFEACPSARPGAKITFGGHFRPVTMPKLLCISVVIATHDPSRTLRRTLAALSRQTEDSDLFETIAAVDGATNDTVEVTDSWSAKLALK